MAKRHYQYDRKGRYAGEISNEHPFVRFVKGVMTLAIIIGILYVMSSS